MGENEILISKIQRGENEKQNKELLFNNIYGSIEKEIKIHYGNRSDIDDLIQEGCLIVLEMIYKYDHTRGASFLSYMRNYLILKLERERAQKGTCFRLSYRTQRLVKNYKYFWNSYLLTNGREPQPCEIMNGLGISKEQLDIIRNAINYSNGTSYNAEIYNEGEGVELLELIEDHNINVENEVIERVYKEGLKRDIQDCINTLEGEKREIIKLKYFEGKPLTEISKILGIPMTVIYGYERRILKSMRESGYVRGKLLPYLENESIYNNSIKGTGINAFNTSWTSSTERVAIESTEIKKELLHRLRF